MQTPNTVRGAHLGVDFPPTIERLLEQGADFLTRAFHATGAIGIENRVTAIRQHSEFIGGGMGRKLALTVDYLIPETGLQTDLFAKFPRDFGDLLRSLFGPLMEPEVRFALLSRRDDFPITVPQCYFADYDPQTTSGILITERIPYGEAPIEPLHDKCLDDDIDDPGYHYRALTLAMARLAAAHKSGEVGPNIERDFPFDPNDIDPGSRIPFTPDQLSEKLALIRDFADRAPQLFPTGLGDTAFLERFSSDAMFVLEHENLFRAHLNHQSDLIALCHWNINLDNAWFWRDEKGVLQAGLLDWGGVSQMNVAMAFFGMICAAELDFLDTQKDALIDLFVEEFHRCGCPEIDRAVFAQSTILATALLGIAWLLDAPTIATRELPTIDQVSGRHDPALRSNFLARSQVQIMMVLLNEWRREDIGTVLRNFVAAG